MLAWLLIKFNIIHDYFPLLPILIENNKLVENVCVTINWVCYKLLFLIVANSHEKWIG